MGSSGHLSRRTALKLSTGAAALPLVHMRSAGAAGKLSVVLHDHYVPACTAEMQRQVEIWSQKNKVEVQVDFLNALRGKLQLTQAAEAQAKAGHDVMTFWAWDVHNYADHLEPVDDVVARLDAKYGRLSQASQYLARLDGRWMAVPTANGTQNQSCCGRIDLFRQHCGIDLQAMYPASEVKAPEAEQWTWETMLVAAEKCQKAGYPFALGISPCIDSVSCVGAQFTAYGAELVDAHGSVTVNSDKVRQALDYAVRLARFLPSDVYSYDDASNNRALISGKSALIFNPPSAWAVAKRDAPHVAEQCWTFSCPRGPAGRFVPFYPSFWGIWSFSRNKGAARDLIEYLSQREQVQLRDNAAAGYDIPPYDSMSDFEVWSKVEPPLGTVFNYPIRPHHDAQLTIAGFPAPPGIAVQIFTRGIMPTMIAKVTQSGQSIDQAIAWAQSELEGLRR